MSWVRDNELCSWCLGARNASMAFRCLGCNTTETPGNPVRVLYFGEEHAWGEGAVIEMGPLVDVLQAVGTWHGDPICASHLMLATAGNLK